MIAITGKAWIRTFLFFICVPFLSWATDISLKLTNMDNVPLTQAGIGQPFLLHVIVRNTTNTAQYPDIRGTNNIHIRNSGFQMNIVNGSTSITYQYQIRIDTAGEYTIGPACLNEPSGKVESEPIKVIVDAQQKTNDMKHTSNSTNGFLRLTTDKQQAVVGEKIHCTLTFYSTDTVSVQNIIEPEHNDDLYTIKNKEGPLAGTETIKAQEYRYLQWQWDLYPKKSGNLIIPAYAAEFISKMSSQSLISFMFGKTESKRAYSNASSVQVMELPVSQKPIVFIGTLDTVTAKLDQSSLQTGQGALLTISLHGNGDFDPIGTIPLLNMPEQLKWYESKHETHPINNQQGAVHTMEYIVQAKNPGTYQIPSQTIHYFDTKDRDFKSKTTVPLTLFVNGTAKPTPVITPILPTKECEHTDDIRPLHKEGPWTTPHYSYIPWRLFWILIILLFFAWCCFTTFKIIKRIRTISSLFIQTRTHIKNAYEKQNYAALYAIFMQFFAALYQVSPAALAQENINDLMACLGLPKEELEHWNSFFSHIEQARFYNDQTVPSVNLYHQSISWIECIEKLYRRKK